MDQYRYPITHDGYATIVDGNLATSRNGHVAARPSRRAASPQPVSQSSYLNERDRYYRAAETVDNAIDLADRSVDGILALDERLRQARANDATPLALVLIERKQVRLSDGADNLIDDFMNRPYERW
jgi:hypothetical protein